MIPAVTAVRLTGAAHRGELPLLVLGPPLGTSATAAWSETAARLTDAFDVVAWDLPGHGHNRSVPEDPFTLEDLAAGVLAVVDEILLHRDEVGGSFSCAGVGLGGAVALQLLLDVPGRVRDAVVVDTETYAADACSAGGPLAFDLRERLGGISAPVLAASGTQDVAELIRGHALPEPPDDRDDHLGALETHLRAALASGVTVAEVQGLLDGLAPPPRGGGE